MQKQSLKDRIIAFFKGGDDGKLSRFETKLGKYLKKQIEMRRESIETLKEKISDANDAFNEAVVRVDAANALSSTEATDTYVSKYVANLSAKFSEIEALEAKIKLVEEEIVHFEKLEKAIYPEVAEA